MSIPRHALRCHHGSGSPSAATRVTACPNGGQGMAVDIQMADGKTKPTLIGRVIAAWPSLVGRKHALDERRYGAQPLVIQAAHGQIDGSSRHPALTSVSVTIETLDGAGSGSISCVVRRGKPIAAVSAPRAATTNITQNAA